MAIKPNTQGIPPQTLRVPENAPVNPQLLNAHLMVLSHGHADNLNAWQAWMQKVTTGSAPVPSIAASGTATITVTLAQPMPNALYIVNATVEGTSLQVVNVLRSKTTVQVTIHNTDTINPHTGTVMVWAYNPA